MTGVRATTPKYKRGRRESRPSASYGSRRSVARDDRAAEVEAIIDAELKRVLVIVEAAERHQYSGRHEAGVAEIIVLILALGRPVLGDHVFHAGADGVAVAMVGIEREGERRACKRQGVAVIGIGVAAFDVDQTRAPGVADTGGDRSQRALVAGEGEAGGEHRIEIVAAEPGVLPLDAENP